MKPWSDLNARVRPEGLETAHQRRMKNGQTRFTFVHDGLEIDDPTLDLTGRFFASPREYGFTIRGFEGGRTAWARDFANGSMLVVNGDGESHVLSPKLPSRILFVDTNGVVLQDSGAQTRTPPATQELATVRLTLNVTFDLQGRSPEAARRHLVRLLDAALVQSGAPTAGQPFLLHHAYETSAVLHQEAQISADTDFSKLLDI